MPRRLSARTRWGGASFSKSKSNGTVSGCVFDSNTGAERGGAIYFTNASGNFFGTVENSLFINNEASAEGGAICVYYGGCANLRFCTIVANKAGSGGGISAVYSQKARFKVSNSIICGNESLSNNTTGDLYARGTAFASSFALKGNYTPDGAGESPVLGAPRFLSPHEGNYRLRYSSGAIDSACVLPKAETPPVDLDGNARIAGANPDPGCYEYSMPANGALDIVFPSPFGSMEEEISLAAVSSLPLGNFILSWRVLDEEGNELFAGEGENVSAQIGHGGYVTLELSASEAGNPQNTLLCRLSKAILLRPGNVYVLPFGGASGGVYPYDTPQKATTNIFAAIEAVNDGGTVNFPAGTYKTEKTIKLLRGVTLLGTEGRDRTVIQSAKDGDRILYMNGEGAAIRGITLSGARANCYKSENGNDNNGAGVYITNRGGSVEDCRITDCSTANYNGTGVLYCKSPMGKIDRTIIDDNDYFRGFGNAYGAQSVAVYISGGTIANSLVCNNRGPNGGGIRVTEKGRVVNCTVANNQSTSGTGGGIIFGALTPGEGLVMNTVSTGNRAATSMQGSAGYPEWTIAATAPSALEAVSNSVVNCSFGKDFAYPLGSGYANASPCFRDAPNGDYSLHGESELIDAGVAPEFDFGRYDLSGKSRVSGDGIDIGAYEFDLGAISIDASINPNPALEGEIVSFRAALRGANPADYAFSWELASRDSSQTLPGGQSAAVSDLVPGIYSVSLKLLDPSDSSVIAAAPPVSLKIGAATNYVVTARSDGLDGTKPYASWENATTNLANAIEEAVPGAVVLLGDGVHTVSSAVFVTNAVTVTSLNGFERTSVVKDPNAPRSRVFFINNNDAVVDGLTISGGNESGTWAKGMAVLIETEGGTLSRCRLTANHYPFATVEGVVAVKYSDSIGNLGLVDRCVFDGNLYKSYTYYGSGGALYMTGGIVRQSLFFGNQGCQYGAVGASGRARIENCTIVSNKCFVTQDTSGAGGINFSSGDSRAFAANNVFAFNLLGNEPSDAYAGGGAAANAAACFVRNLFSDSAAIGQSAIPEAPKFKQFFPAPLLGCHALSNHSPGYKSGIVLDWMDGAKDIAKAGRITRKGERTLVDLGCYESPYIPAGMKMILK